MLRLGLDRVVGLLAALGAGRAQATLALGQRELRVAVRAAHVRLGLAVGPLLVLAADPVDGLREEREEGAVLATACRDVARKQAHDGHDGKEQRNDVEVAAEGDGEEREDDGDDEQGKAKLVCPVPSVHKAAHCAANLL